MGLYLILLSTFICQPAIHTVEALTCLACSFVAQPRHCDTVMTCPQPDDVCYLERRTNSFGEEGYALGCILNHSCKNVSSVSPTSDCSQCCDKSLCNSGGCGQPGFPEDRGPVCYDCSSPLPDGRCHNVDVCRKGEVCSVTGKDTFGTTVFKSKCIPKDECGVHQVGLIIGKKRYTDHHDCFQCCETDICNNNCQTQADGQWGSWTTWSMCTSHCNQTRTRECDNPAPLPGGTDCPGLTTQTQGCYTDQCQLDGQWGSWTAWSLCTSHCNQTRTRACDNPASLHGGRDCPGLTMQTQGCYTDQCQMDGQWGSWTTWSMCTSHCNQTRTRGCNNPAPLHGGRDCLGLTAQTQGCYTDQCQIEGQWGVWTTWSSCTSRCNQTRTRACDNPSTLHGGMDCTGLTTQTQSCYTDLCQIDGQWGSWTTWSLCTSDCNQTRTRACDNPAPVNGGSDCPGNMTQTQGCYTSVCPVTDCSVLLSSGAARLSGVFNITTPLTHTKIQVYCDMETDGGGWTVFQRRFDGSVDFYRNFSEYENGFGFVYAEHWLGLKYLHEIAYQGGNQLRLDIVRVDGSKGFDVYDKFSVEPGTQYTFHVGSRSRFSGCKSLLESSSGTPDGNSFSTYDHDNDKWSGSGNCAQERHGGWWYNSCSTFNPNGLYQPGTTDSATMQYAYEEGLTATTLMFKPI